MKLAAEPVLVRWELFADEALQRLVRQGEVATDATRGHSVHVPLQGLEPGREYWYRFLCGDALSRVGRTRTAPAPGAPVQRLRRRQPGTIGIGLGKARGAHHNEPEHKSNHNSQYVK